VKKVKDIYSSEKGFTLIEVVASLVIISIILLGAYGLLIFSNETAQSNNDKLVAINVGKATIERIKIDPNSYFGNIRNYVLENGFSVTLTSENCMPENCEELYQLIINDKNYDIAVTISQSEEAVDERGYSEIDLRLINVLVQVELDDAVLHQVEGYVSYGY